MASEATAPVPPDGSEVSVRAGRWAASLLAGRVRRLPAGADPLRAFFAVPLGIDRRLQLLEGRRLQRRPRLDARQLPLLLQRPDLRPDAVGDRLGVRASRPRSRSPSRSRSPTGSSATCRRGCSARCSCWSSCPFWTSYLLRVYSWLNILGDKGAINRLLRGRTSPTTRSRSSSTTGPAVILVLVYLYFPFAALTLYSSLERFDWDQFRAAMDLGAPPMTAMRRILLPQIKPGIVTARHLRLHPDPRRVPHAADRRRRAGRDDREPDRQLLLGRRSTRAGAAASLLDRGVDRRAARDLPPLARDRGPVCARDAEIVSPARGPRARRCSAAGRCSCTCSCSRRSRCSCCSASTRTSTGRSRSPAGRRVVRAGLRRLPDQGRARRRRSRSPPR